MCGYCPDCGYNLYPVIFYGNNGCYLRAWCSFCGYIETVVR
jgi:hypothetical protein